MKTKINIETIIAFLLSIITLLVTGILFSTIQMNRDILHYSKIEPMAITGPNRYSEGMQKVHYKNKTFYPSEKQKEAIISPFADRQVKYACDGENRTDRICEKGFTQGCVPSIACECNDGWQVYAGPVDGCVKWEGAYIPKNVEGYAFAGECEQMCRLSGRSQ